MYEKELEIAKEAALKAGKFLCQRKGIDIQLEKGKDIKLSSDKYSEKIIMEILEKSGYPILSEEYGIKGELKDVYWIIDPLDGTVNYLRGIDELSCVSIALWVKDSPKVGVVYLFRNNQLFWGSCGNGAYLNNEKIRVSDVKNIERAVLATGFPLKRSYDSKDLKSFIDKVRRFKKIRMLGAAAVMGVFTACGKFDAYIEEGIMLWDVAAAVAIADAAGACVDIKPLEENKCICSIFATDELKEEYYNVF